MAITPKMDSDAFFFYSKSKDVPPGKGTHESIRDASAYQTLASIPNWRRILSNFHVAPFKFEGYTYNTIEHVFQAKKIALLSPESAFYFTVESGHAIGKGDGEFARKNRKLILLDDDTLEAWDAIKDGVMERAAAAKYAACEEARNVLKATGSAQLWHIVMRGRPVRFQHLERIRAHLRNTDPATASSS